MNLKEEIAISLFIALSRFSESVNLRLEYLNQCTFHLVHYQHQDTAMTEGVLHSNQYQQPWTVYNFSRPTRGLLPTTVEREQVSWGPYRESRFCNVHLLIKPTFASLEAAETYPGMLNVREGNYASFILVHDQSLTVEVLRSTHIGLFGQYTFKVFFFQVDPNKGEVRQKLWICFPCDTNVQQIPLGTQVVGRYSLELYHMGRNFHGKQLRIFHPYATPKSLSLRCPTEFYMPGHTRWRRQKHLNWLSFMNTCTRDRAVVLLIGSKLNASITVTNDRKEKTGVYATVQVESLVTRVRQLQTMSSWLSENVVEHLVYCERHGRRDAVGWLDVYDSSTWAALVLAVLAVTLIESAYVDPNSGLWLRNLDWFNILRLIQQDGTVRTKFHLGVMLCACVFLAHYENYLTSVAMAPGPPHIHKTVQALLGDGYKIGWHDTRTRYNSVPPEILHRRELERLKLLHRINSTFQRVHRNVETPLDRIASLYPLFPWFPKSKMLPTKTFQLVMTNSTCHTVEEPFGLTKSHWVTMWGMLRDEMLWNVQLIREHGFMSLWFQVHFAYMENFLLQRERELPTDTDPPRVSMDFEVIKIFPYCACVLGVSALVFLLEFGLLLATAWRAIKMGTFAIGL